MADPSVDDVQVRVRLADGREEWWPLRRIFDIFDEELARGLRETAGADGDPETAADES